MLPLPPGYIPAKNITYICFVVLLMSSLINRLYSDATMDGTGCVVEKL